uniref:Uncharacterized protein n=1 Tax=Arundo donax TaxID=35708 RepID=A0A0A9CXY5_ARUDO
MEGHHHQDPPQGLRELDFRHAPPYPRHRNIRVSPRSPPSPHPGVLAVARRSGRIGCGFGWPRDPCRVRSIPRLLLPSACKRL